ncbi:Sugar transporter [Croceitalea dokdonensis DOKDO 023]|uniref:Sugar transporter n=1 Tax=Croceitalea dokdonensis DOKDO 023 TaxID=1300341 RepID=A0A0P7AU31_9FLAO|nr:MFS transporter [Croceitalea dokdonensis]KPM31352.1 Sugar transporter [Croceitalea dokdonensis DOKDO 023]
MKINKPKLNFWQIWNMNVGFFGIQFSFGLQQTAINPIFEFLGAHHNELPLLNLAGPVTGLLIQPIIGAISDKTWLPKWGGRRKPFFLIGAIAASLCLFAFPFSPGLWFAVGLLWVLDAANNTAMEPYRAFVGDKLPDEQLTFGYQMQSLFVGAGITLANFSLFLFQDWFSVPADAAASLCSVGADDVNAIPTWVYYSFFLGAFASVATVLWSVFKTPEIPPTDEELVKMKQEKADTSFGKRLFFPILEIVHAIGNMPKLMWRLAAVYFFQWYALFCYWQFITPMVRKSLKGISDADTDRYEGIMEACKSGAEISTVDTAFAQNIQLLSEQALAQTGLMNGTYNFVTMITALALVPLAVKYSSKIVYVVSLILTGIAMLSMPYINNEYALLIPMVLFGIGWAAMMGIPYAMVSQVIPEDRRGVYMGIVNMMIVIPMLIQTVTFGTIIENFLGNNAVNAILFGGVFFIIAALLATRLNVKNSHRAT